MGKGALGSLATLTRADGLLLLQLDKYTHPMGKGAPGSAATLTRADGLLLLQLDKFHDPSDKGGLERATTSSSLNRQIQPQLYWYLGPMDMEEYKISHSEEDLDASSRQLCRKIAHLGGSCSLSSQPT